MTPKPTPLEWAGIVLVLVAQLLWDGSYYSTMTYDTGDYYSTITTTIRGTDAWGVGYGPLLGLLLALPVVGLLVTAWRAGFPGRALLLAGPTLTLLASLALAARDSARVDSATGYSSFELQAPARRRWRC